jgi:hypothetical protein
VSVTDAPACIVDLRSMTLGDALAPDRLQRAERTTIFAVPVASRANIPSGRTAPHRG